MKRAVLALLLLAASTLRGKAQQVRIADYGPGPVGPSLAHALAGPHRLFTPGPDTVVLHRDSTYDRTVIVLSRTVLVDGTVHGDVFVVGGDMHVHPGAQIDGRAVAVGGAVYPSALAIIRGRVESYRDFTYEAVASAGGYALSYRELQSEQSPPLTFPGLYGLRLPSYDRTNGVSLPFGPTLALADTRIEIDPTATYRSQLGVVDPAVEVAWIASRRTRFLATASRGTFSNDAWIWKDLVNSVASLFGGKDTRNYYRADRAELTAYRLWETPTKRVVPYLGARWERAKSARPDSSANGGPWSLYGRRDRTDGMLRGNPHIDPGHIASALVGTSFEWTVQDVSFAMELGGEGAFTAPRDKRFFQATLDTRLRFQTVAQQSFQLDAHLVATLADTAPRQRWVYLGGAGTLPLLDLLSLGGDQLLYVESAYTIPIRSVNLPFVGMPLLTLRHIVGSAGISSLPDLDQDLGARLSLSFLRLSFDIDPASRRTEVGVGLSIAR